jgi:hypothetical protein
MYLPDDAAGAAMGPFVRLWRGQQPLPVAFWFFFLGGTLLSQAIAVILGFSPYFVRVPRLIILLLYVATAIYAIFAAVGVWRSADTYPSRRWRVAAKIAVCVFLWDRADRMSVDFFQLIDPQVPN